MKYFSYLAILVLVSVVSFISGSKWNTSQNNKETMTSPTPVPTPLSRYSIDNLARADIKAGEFEITNTLEEAEEFTAYEFKLTFDPSINNETSKITTGQVNIPKNEGSFPLVLMIRGYVDETLYTTGIGTRRGAEVFASEGFITVAPDFLGYAGSDTEAGNIFESRFQTYTTVLSLLKSLDQIDSWNGKDVFIWAHSNGGQIAITTLEVTGAVYPTTLWAPVTKPFPYSVLYYTDESPDRGKFIRQELSKFEELYNPDLFAITDYIDRINAPIQIHQGTADDAIPVEWSNEFVSQLESAEVEHEYLVYPGADHNLRPNWNTVVERDIEFFRKHL